MEHSRHRRRIRISTLMLLVIIAALSSALLVDRWKRHQEEQRLNAELERAVAQAEQARASEMLARANAAQAQAVSNAMGRRPDSSRESRDRTNEQTGR